jgi:hypothetical protein
MPAGAVHIRVNITVPEVVGVTVCVPLAAGLPDHPPLAVHAEAFVANHVNVADCPARIVVGSTEIVIVGASGGCEPDPPYPLPPQALNNEIAKAAANRADVGPLNRPRPPE